MELPLFPLHSVLCPGVALPLHIFEDRYRLMIDRCIARSEPFGVVFIREGREVGDRPAQLAEIGTTALIREAGRHTDGRLDIVTVGGRRFRIRSVDGGMAPYLVGDVALIAEESGGDAEATGLAGRVGRRFLRYLQLLQPALAGGGSEVEIVVEIEVDAPDDTDDGESEDLPVVLDLMTSVEPLGRVDARIEAGLDDLSPDERRELLMAAARRLTATDDPTTLSFLLTGLIQVELGTRQDLLEASDTVTRLSGLDAVLTREIRHLSRHLKPLHVDGDSLHLRRN